MYIKYFLVKPPFWLESVFGLILIFTHVIGLEVKSISDILVNNSWIGLSSGVQRNAVPWKLADDSEECIIFRAEEQAKQEKGFACCLHHDGFLLGVLFGPGNGGYLFIRNIGWNLTDYAAFYPRWYNLS
jgi:hypothetical protein